MDAASLLTLQGAGAYDAAVHCASVSAAKRLQQHQGPATSISPPGELRAGAVGNPSIVQSRPQPYSTIPGYNRAMTEQNMQQTFHRRVPLRHQQLS